MFLPFINHLEVACFVFQVIVTMALILGLEMLGTLLTGNVHVARLAILVNFFLFFDHGLGDVELYNDALQGSGISVAIIAFGLYFFLRRRYVIAYFWLEKASIIHPVEGLTVYLVMLAAMFIYIAVLKEGNWRTFMSCLAIYTFTAGVFIAVFLAGKISGNALFRAFR